MLSAEASEFAIESDVESFARVHVGKPTPQFVANLSTRVELIGAAEHRVPVTVNFAERGIEICRQQPVVDRDRLIDVRVAQGCARRAAERRQRIRH